MNLFKFFFPHKHAKLTELEHDVYMLNRLVEQIADTRNAYESEAGMFRQGNEHLTQALDKAHEERHMLEVEKSHLEARVEDLEGEKLYLTQRVEELNEQAERLVDGCAEQAEKAHQLEQENEYLRDEKLNLQNHIEYANEQINELSEEINELRSISEL